MKFYKKNFEKTLTKIYFYVIIQSSLAKVYLAFGQGMHFEKYFTVIKGLSVF